MFLNILFKLFVLSLMLAGKLNYLFTIFVVIAKYKTILQSPVKKLRSSSFLIKQFLIDN